MVVSTLLMEYGAEQTFDGYIYDLYFDTVDNQLQKYGYSVRLRFQWDTCIIAFKQKKKDKHTKVMVENEFVVYDIFSVLQLLLCYGLCPYRCKYKKRISFFSQDTCFDIDMYESIPPLLEIESAQTETIFSRVKKLQLEHHVQLTVGSRWLMKYYAAMQQQG